jgi:hypothetical protein
MRRYIFVAAIAELLCTAFVCGHGRQERQHAIYNAQPHADIIPIEYLHKSDEWFDKERKLESTARNLAFQLDLLDNAPILVGLPAIAVLGLWTWERRRKQKSRESPV